MTSELIRPFKKEDITKISQIEKECFTKPWTEHMLKCEYDNPLFRCFVYFLQNEILGYVNFFCVGSDQIDIGNCAVTPKFQRRGAAKALIAHLIDYCKHNGIKNISLEVNSQNTAAINLYCGFNFKTEGLRKNYYGENSDALIMWLRF